MTGHSVTVPLSPISSTITPVLPDPLYCRNFKMVGSAYKRIHGYTSVTVCTFGVIANTLNLIVLTRKDMINSTNSILTGLALADLFNMVEYVPFAIYMNFLPDDDGGERKTYPWAVYVLVHSNFSQVCHTISIWLTLTLAVWRYIMISMPLRCKTLCSMQRAKWLIASAYLISPILCLPIYFTFSISTIAPSISSTTVATELTTSINNSTDFTEVEEQDYFNVTTPFVTFDDENTSSVASTQSSYTTPQPAKYVVNLSALAKKYPLLMTANFWFYSVVFKLLPCVMLTIVSFRLINSLLEAKRRKEKLFGIHIAGLPVVRAETAHSTGVVASGVPSSTLTVEDASTNSGSRSGSFTRPTGEMCVTTRTTRMLLAVLFLFLITEFPQGILALLSDLLGDKFFKECYYPLSDLMDFVALLNSAINFILYCSMSTKFRDVFCQVFHLTPMLNFCEAHRCRRRRRQGSIVSQSGNNGEVSTVSAIRGQMATRNENNGENHH